MEVVSPFNEARGAVSPSNKTGGDGLSLMRPESRSLQGPKLVPVPSVSADPYQTGNKWYRSSSGLGNYPSNGGFQLKSEDIAELKALVMKAYNCVDRMEKKNVKPNDVTRLGVFSGCTKKLDLDLDWYLGRWVCFYLEMNELPVNLTLRNTMPNMYLKCGATIEAKGLFDKRPRKDIFYWVTMFDGYVKLRNYDGARHIFKEVYRKDIDPWNALISTYERDSKPMEALATFRELLLGKNPKLDEATLVCTLFASTGDAISPGFCSWNFYTNDMQAFQFDGGVNTFRIILGPLSHTVVHGRKSILNNLVP